MAMCYDWPAYGLTGPPLLSLGDYTIHAFGCERTIDHFAKLYARIRQRSESVRWILMDYWGRGKSTLMYNFCHHINDRRFFKATLPTSLALYVDYPRRACDLLDYTYENGLPFPWVPKEERSILNEKRRKLFLEALRLLAYGVVRIACRDKGFAQTPRFRLILSHSRTKTLANSGPLESMRIADSMKKPDSHDSLAECLREYIAHLINCNKISSDYFSKLTKDNFPNLVYPSSSMNFLQSVSNLFSGPRRGLRDFTEFHRLCEFGAIHVLMVIDEAEDWRNMAKTGLDDFLIEILPTNKLSIVLILRTDVLNRLRGIQKRLRYVLVKTWMKEYRHVPDPNPQEILKITKGILLTSRVDKSLNLFPFTEDFVFALSNLTVRGGHFNMRMFVRSLGRLLKLSLSWSRSTLEIDHSFLKRAQVIDAVAKSVIEEDRRELESSILSSAEEIQRKMRAARELSGHLIGGKVDPPTTYMFDIVRDLVSEKYEVSALSNIEIIAYSKRTSRPRVHKMIGQLKDCEKPNRTVIEALKWHFSSKVMRSS